MMRCPFCASPRAALPECWACGMSLVGVDMASVQPTLKDLEPTRYDPVVVQAERIADLLTWKREGQDAGVDELLTDRSLAAHISCSNCGREFGAGAVCDFCGAGRLVAHAHTIRDGHEGADAQSACCSHCGTPNAEARALCRNCGTRLEL
jgi:hypothetical protein